MIVIRVYLGDVTDLTDRKVLFMMHGPPEESLKVRYCLKQLMVCEGVLFILTDCMARSGFDRFSYA